MFYIKAITEVNVNKTLQSKGSIACLPEKIYLQERISVEAY